MLLYNLITAFRFVRKNPTYSLINITGLSLGIALVTISLLWIRFELSYDRFHKNSDRIFRVVAEFRTGENIDNFAHTPAPLGEALKREIPEVVDYVRLGSTGRILVNFGDKQFWEEVDLADPSIFKIFSFDLAEGLPGEVLKDPKSIIISETRARRYFGNTDPVGRILRLGYEKAPFTVTGVMKDIPENSQLQFDFLASFSNLKSHLEWGIWNYATYILAINDRSAGIIREKLPDFTKKYIKDRGTFLHIQPLKKIHLHSRLRGDLSTNRDIKVVYIFTSICLLMLVIACVNYMNLATARYTSRCKEIGLRKVAGASNRYLINQFMSESFIMAILALLFSLFLCSLLLHVFNSLTDLHMRLASVFNVVTVTILLVLIIGVAFFAGSYPSLVLSALNPVSAVNRNFRITLGLSAKSLRKSLVIFQFIVAITLIGSAAVIRSQMRFIGKKDLGLSPDQALVIPILQDEIKSRYESFKAELLNNSLVLNATAVNYFPGNQGFYQNVWWEGLSDNNHSNMIDWIPVDQDFINTLGIQLAKGGFFPANITKKSPPVYVLNESAVKMTGWDDPVGKEFDIIGKGTVIGVVRDFNFKSLHSKLNPMALTFYPDLFDNLIVKLSNRNISGTIDFIKGKWEDFFPQFPFEYSFLDEDFQKMYEHDNATLRIIGYVSIMALFIASIGLFGLVLFSIDQRVREIGIRKVAGASSSDILIMLNLEFIRNILFSFLFSLPVIIYFVNSWLENFAYRIRLNPWMFIIPGFIIFGLTAVIVTLLTYLAATRNPVECIRNE